MKIVPCCCHPTQVVFLDDQLPFLESLLLELDLSTKRCLLFDDIDDALQCVNSEKARKNFLERIFKVQSSYKLEQTNVNVQTGRIYEEIYHKERFAQVCTLVIDYDMPMFNGLEVCQQVTNPNVRKILLTGAADEHVAIEAFNKGLIQQYIPKGSNKVASLMDRVIYDAQTQYFEKLTEVVLNTVRGHSEQETALDDPLFVRFFEKFIKDHSIIEYYLFDSLGSFLLVDVEGRLSNLFLKTEEQMKGLYWEAKDEEELSATVKGDLKNMSKMLCYHIRDDQPIPDPSEWEQHLRPAQQLKGLKNTYYWAHCNNCVNLETSRKALFAH
jgi:CheY-like chemotaxis protein